jgi:ATP-dependent Clp protease ATP-binding subunit ClpX
LINGIDKIISRRLSANSLGFSKASDQDEQIDTNNMMQYVSPADLKSFGLIPELIGRLPVITHLMPLDAESLRRILTEPKNALVRQYQKLFEMENIKLTFQPEVYDFIVEKAVEFKLGARGLRSICEAIMLDAMYEVPSAKNEKEFEVTIAYAREKFKKASINKLRVA